LCKENGGDIEGDSPETGSIAQEKGGVRAFRVRLSGGEDQGQGLYAEDSRT